MGIVHSFQNAFRGLWFIVRHEKNARIHLGTATVAVVICLWLRVSSLELVAVCFSIVIVFIAEILNSGIEQLANIVSPEHDPRIRHIKDITAAAVLVSAIAAAVIGALVIINHFKLA